MEQQKQAAPPLPEPWLRGALADVHPLVRPVFFSFAQVREDLATYTADLRTEDVWKNFDGASVGFHLKHMAGSVDRLATYLMGRQLDAGQLSALKNEHAGGALNELLADLDRSFSRAEEQLRTLDPAITYDLRTVGRLALPTTVIGLIVHLCEHTQRHLGQAITLAKLAAHRD